MIVLLQLFFPFDKCVLSSNSEIDGHFSLKVYVMWYSSQLISPDSSHNKHEIRFDFLSLWNLQSDWTIGFGSYLMRYSLLIKDSVHLVALASSHFYPVKLGIYICRFRFWLQARLLVSCSLPQDSLILESVRPYLPVLRILLQSEFIVH